MAEKTKEERRLDRLIREVQKEILKIYNDAADALGFIGATTYGVSSDIPFSLANHPLVKKRVDDVLRKFRKKLNAAVVNGVRSAWTLANNKNDELCRMIFGPYVDSLTLRQQELYFSNHGQALDAFLERKAGGLGLSDRVWNYTEQFREQIELGLELGIKSGQSAASMARDLKYYLKYPDKLFRRVRGADGRLHLSNPAKAFHPGQGVYRSSYQNALRLAATETNMAYRTADHKRVQSLDFVVGIEVRLSNNHTCNGVPFADICDELKGKYPKDFLFRGWHPKCRCHTISILKTPEEVMRDMDGIDRGSVNEVRDMPENFNAWVERNRDRIDAAEARGTLPYFLRDNRWTWDGETERPGTEVPAAEGPTAIDKDGKLAQL